MASDQLYDEQEILEKIRDLVLTQEKIVTIHYVSQQYSIPVRHSQQIINKFIDQLSADKKRDNVTATYLLTGFAKQDAGQDSGDSSDVRVLKVMQVDDDELDNCKEEYFSQVSGTAIKSVRAKDVVTAEKENYAKPDEDNSWIRDASDLERAKSLQPIQCQEVGIRTTGRSVPIFPAANDKPKKPSDKTSDSPVVEKLESNGKCNGFTDSLSQKSCDENRMDDRGDSDEESTKEEDEVVRKRSKEPETAVSVPSDSDEEDEDVVVPKKRRRVVLADDSDDEEPVEPVKTENKRQAKQAPKEKPAPKEKAAKPALKEKVAPTQREKPAPAPAAPKEKPVASKGRSTKGKVAPVPQKKITDFFSRS